MGGIYSQVSQKEINSIKILIDDENVINIKLIEDLFKVGEQRMIAYGPLAGLECSIENIKNQNHIIVRLLQSLGNYIIATVPPSYISRFSKVI